MVEEVSPGAEGKEGQAPSSGPNRQSPLATPRSDESQEERRRRLSEKAKANMVPPRQRLEQSPG